MQCVVPSDALGPCSHMRPATSAIISRLFRERRPSVFGRSSTCITSDEALLWLGLPAMQWFFGTLRWAVPSNSNVVRLPNPLANKLLPHTQSVLAVSSCGFTLYRRASQSPQAWCH